MRGAWRMHMWGHATCMQVGMVSPLGQCQITLPITLSSNKASAREELIWLSLIGR